MKKFVAVKVIDRERLVLISQRNREEEALGLLRTKLPEHPHLIRVHHVGAEGSHFYYVMDLADDAIPSPQDSSTQEAIKVETYRPLTLDEHVHDAGRLPVDDVIIRACAPASDDRFDSAETFDKALDDCLVRIESGTPKRRQVLRRVFMGGLVIGIAAWVALVGSGIFKRSHSDSHRSDGKWISL